MNPATIALLASALIEATKYGVELAELIRRYNSGELDEAAVMAEYKRHTDSYRSARQIWDAAGETTAARADPPR